MSFTPTLEQVIEQAIESKLAEVNTCIPCIVDSYNPAEQTINAQIALKKFYADTEQLVDRPIIPDVPLIFPKGGNSSLTFPIKKGDDGLLIFSQRSIERWKVGSGVVDPKDSRKFHLSDAFFIPTGGRDTKVISGVDATKTRLVNDKSIIELSEDGTILVKNDTASVKVDVSGLVEVVNANANIKLNPSGLVEINNANGKIRMTAAGKFKLEGAGGKELLDIVDRFLATMQGAQVLTAFGLQNFWPPTPTTLTQIKADLTAIKE